MEKSTTDLIVIGGGPVGLFTCFYGGMRKASVKLIESMPQLGGQLSALYPEKFIYDVAGFPKVTAQDLVERLIQQMMTFPIQIHLEEKVLRVEKQKERDFVVETDRELHHAKSIVLTGGAGAFQPRKLELPEAERFEGRNLHYFISDFQRFRGKKVLISGGGDTAVDWALMLEPVAEKVTLVHRRDKFRAHEYSIEKLRNSSVEIKVFREITGILGQEQAEFVNLCNTISGEMEQIPIDEMIVNYGFVSSLGPISEWGLDIEKGAIPVDTRMQTNIEGFFAAGDIVRYPGKVKLIASGFGEAPTAINNAMVYINPSANLSPGHSSNMKFA